MGGEAGAFWLMLAGCRDVYGCCGVCGDTFLRGAGCAVLADTEIVIWGRVAEGTESRMGRMGVLVAVVEAIRVWLRRRLSTSERQVHTRPIVLQPRSQHPTIISRFTASHHPAAITQNL